jgi:hypothetical protein
MLISQMGGSPFAAMTRRGTKNWTVRHVPLIADAGALLRRMRNERTAEPETEEVLRVHEAETAMDNAAGRVGMVRITHHDLCHLFATIASKAAWTSRPSPAGLATKTAALLP